MKLVKKSGIGESLKRRKVKSLREQDGGEYVWVDWTGLTKYFSSPKEAGVYVGRELINGIFDSGYYWNIDVAWEGERDSNCGVYLEMSGSEYISVYIGDRRGEFIRDLDIDEKAEFEEGIFEGSGVA